MWVRAKQWRVCAKWRWTSSVTQNIFFSFSTVLWRSWKYIGIFSDSRNFRRHYRKMQNKRRPSWAHCANFSSFPFSSRVAPSSLYIRGAKAIRLAPPAAVSLPITTATKMSFLTCMSYMLPPLVLYVNKNGCRTIFVHIKKPPLVLYVNKMVRQHALGDISPATLDFFWYGVLHTRKKVWPASKVLTRCLQYVTAAPNP